MVNHSPSADYCFYSFGEIVLKLSKLGHCYDFDKVKGVAKENGILHLGYEDLGTPKYLVCREDVPSLLETIGTSVKLEDLE